MSNQQHLLEAIAQSAREATKAEAAVDPTALAIRLSSQFPQSRITIDDIRTAIERALSEARGEAAGGTLG
jgi:hypothetical protein